MANSPNLGIGYLEANQSQKHVTTNEALLALDAIVQLSVLDKDLSAPPGTTPADGARYIVAASPTGLWAGKANYVAAWQDNAWRFYLPKAGWFAFIADESKIYTYSGSAWTLFSGGGTGLPLNSGPVHDTVTLTSGTNTGDVFGSGLKTYILSGGAAFNFPTAIGNKGTYRIKVADAATTNSTISCVVSGQKVAGVTSYSAAPGTYNDFVAENGNWTIVSGF